MVRFKGKLIRLIAISLITLISTSVFAITYNSSTEEVDPYRIIVKYKKRTRDINAIRTQVANFAGIDITDSKPLAGGAHLLILDKNRMNSLARVSNRNPQQNIETILEQIRSNPEVEYAVKDRIMHALAADPAVAPTHKDQWDEFNPPGGVDLPNAWTITKGNRDIIVAVIDTGIAFHKDLAKNVVPGYSFVKHSTNNKDMGNGTGFHGTHVAGTIAANGNLIGMAPNVRVLPVQVLGDGGSGYTSDIISAIYWASGDPVPNIPTNKYPAKVINLSLGGDEHCDAAWAEAFKRMKELNVTVVVAAGNENNDSYNSTPASCDNVITVAATTKEGLRASYSNYGIDVDIAAPGGETGLFNKTGGIVSTIRNGYEYYQGTSMASPHIAGISALLYSVYPEITPEQVLNILQSTTLPFPASTTTFNCLGQYTCGKGIVNAANAVQKAKELSLSH